jgi:hypothetical protein
VTSLFKDITPESANTEVAYIFVVFALSLSGTSTFLIQEQGIKSQYYRDATRFNSEVWVKW